MEPFQLSGPKKILVADDDRDSVAILCALLRILGYEAHGACDAYETLELARQIRPEVVVLDIGIPKINGYQIAEAIKRDPELQHMRLIAFSGYSTMADREMAKEAGFDHYLVKPARKEQLIAAIEGITYAEV